MNDELKHTFELHHCIEQNHVFAASELLQELKRQGLYDVDNSRNMIYLPDSKPLGGQLGVSPHVGGHLKSYTKVVTTELDKIAAGADWQAFLEHGDEAAAQRVAQRVHNLEDTIKTALVNGDLYTNNTHGLSKREVRAINTDFQENISEYRVTHAKQIAELGRLGPPEAQWVGVLQTEQKLVEAVHAVNRPGFKPAAGTIDEGQASLRAAINQAHAGGRLTVSESNATVLREAFAPHVASTLAATEQSTARAIGRGATIKAVVGASLVAGVVDAAEAGERTARSLAQDNPLAAQSQMAHYAGVGVGGWVGGAASGLAAGSWTGPGVIGFIAVGAISGSYVGEKAAKMWDDHKVFNQTDRDDVDWSFNGRQWVRDQRADLRDDGANKPVEQEFSALPEKARELSYRASNAATALALAPRNLEPPRDPYTLRAVRSDTPSLQRADWEHNPRTGEWNRDVVIGFEQRGVPMTRSETATPERAAELNAVSEQVIRDNIANGPAPIAARYDLAYTSAGWASFGAKLPAVNSVLNADTLTASDGNQYRHNDRGQWHREGESSDIAQGNLQLELDKTRAALEPQLAQHKQQTAAIPQWRPPTREEQDRDNLVSTYHAFGVKPDPEPLAAALEAIERTRDTQGIDRATSSLSLEPDAQGKYDINSPITHLRSDSAGVVRVAAVTSRDEIALAMVDLRAPPALIPETLELRIAALSPQQRETQEQALREANREGLSHDQVQQIAQQAAVQATAPAAPRADSIPIDRPSAHTQAPSVTLSDSGPERERSFTAAPAMVAAAPTVKLAPEPEPAKPEPTRQAETPAPAQHQATPANEASPVTRSGPAAPTPEAAVSPPNAATPAPDDVLRPGSEGQEVKFLQYRLDRVGYRGPEGEPLPQTGQYDAKTEQAVRQFQRDQGIADTGMTDPATQQALSTAQHARIESSKVGSADAPAPFQEPPRIAPRPEPLATAEPAAVPTPAPSEAPTLPPHEHRAPTAASDETPQVARSPDRSATEASPNPPSRESTSSVEAIQRNESGVTAQTREAAPLAESQAHARGRAAASRATVRDDEEQAREPSRDAANQAPEPSFDLSQLSPKDQAMFAKIRAGAPNVSDETVALAMVEAKRNGIPDVDRLGQVGIADGTLWLGSVTPGYRAGVEANGPAPPMHDSLREAQTLSQQYELQQAKERELAQQQQSQKQTDAMRPQI